MIDRLLHADLSVSSSFFSNYVVQFCLTHGTVYQKQAILSVITGIPSSTSATAAASAAAANTTNADGSNTTSAGGAGGGVTAIGPIQPHPSSSPGLKVLALSKHKYASNVIEKCFVHAPTPRERMELIEQILGRDSPTKETTAAGAGAAAGGAGGSSNGTAASSTDPHHYLQTQQQQNSPFLSMVKDQYGNFVVQSVLDNATPEERAIIISRIRKYGASLRKIPYGKHIISRIEKLSGQPFVVGTGSAPDGGGEAGEETSPGKPAQTGGAGQQQQQQTSNNQPYRQQQQQQQQTRR